MEAGRQEEHDSLLGKLVELAMGGDLKALTWLLERRHGYLERVERETEKTVRVVLELPAPLDVDRYRELVESKRFAAAKVVT